jgi:hypothetical protein
VDLVGEGGWIEGAVIAHAVAFDQIEVADEIEQAASHCPSQLGEIGPIGRLHRAPGEVAPAALSLGDHGPIRPILHQVHRAHHVVKALVGQEARDFLLPRGLVGDLHRRPHGEPVAESLALGFDLATEGRVVEVVVAGVARVEVGVLAEADLDEAKLQGSLAVVSYGGQPVG